MEKYDGKVEDIEYKVDLSMYDVPGYEINENTYKKYKRSCDRYLDDIAELAESGRNSWVTKFDNLFYKSTLTDKDFFDLIYKGFETNDPEVHYICVDYISYIDNHNYKNKLEQKLIHLINKAFKTNDPEIHYIYASIIQYIKNYTEDKNLLIDKLVDLIKQGLRNDDLNIKERYAEMIIFTQVTNDFNNLIEECLNSNYPEIQLLGVQTYCDEGPYDSKIIKKIRTLIDRGFETNDPKVQLIYAEMLSYYPKNSYNQEHLQKKLTVLVNQGLKGKPEDQLLYAQMAEFVDFNKEGLFEHLRSKLGGRLVESPLYEKNQYIKNDHFTRDKFKKTGSETILLGKTLMGRIILRRIRPDSFLAWKKAFENEDVWHNNGFDYIPVEPIQSFRLNKNGLVDVSTLVLDCDLDKWLMIGGGFVDELYIEKEKIKDVLAQLSIIHGHLYHNKNFCLRFFRNEDGSIDFDRKPNIYAIDFDEARISLT
jgi:hypothetical protein